MTKLGDVCSRFVTWAIDSEGSSRSSALVRIGLGLLCWTRFGGELVLAGDPSLRFLALSVVFFLTTTGMLLGLFSRVSTLAVAALLLFLHYYVGVVLDHGSFSHHHVLLLAHATGLCALTPCGRSYSLDRWLAIRRAERGGPPPPPERGNLMGLRLIVLQLSIVYLASALDKTSLDFLSGERLERIFLSLYAPRLSSATGFHAVAVAVSLGTVALEYALGLGLPFARSRRWLWLPGLLFHGLIQMALPVRTFSATMALLYLAYADADAVHRAIDRMQGTHPSPGSGA